MTKREREGGRGGRVGVALAKLEVGQVRGDGGDWEIKAFA